MWLDQVTLHDTENVIISPSLPQELITWEFTF